MLSERERSCWVEPLKHRQLIQSAIPVIRRAIADWFDACKNQDVAGYRRFHHALNEALAGELYTLSELDCIDSASDAAVSGMTMDDELYCLIMRGVMVARTAQVLSGLQVPCLLAFEQVDASPPDQTRPQTARKELH